MERASSAAIQQSARTRQCSYLVCKAAQGPLKETGELGESCHGYMSESTVFVSERAPFVSENAESEAFDSEGDLTPKTASKPGSAALAPGGSAAGRSWGPGSMGSPSRWEEEEDDEDDLAELERASRRLAARTREAYLKRRSSSNFADEVPVLTTAPGQGLPRLLGAGQHKDLAAKTASTTGADTIADGNEARNQGSEPWAAQRLAPLPTSLLRQCNFGCKAPQACRPGAWRPEACLSFASESTAFLSDRATPGSGSVESDGFDSGDDLASKASSPASVSDVASGESTAGIAVSPKRSVAEASDLADLEHISRQLAASALEAYRQRLSQRRAAKEVPSLGAPGRGLPTLLGSRQRKDAAHGPRTPERAAHISKRPDSSDSEGSPVPKTSSVAGITNFASGKSAAGSAFEAGIPICSAGEGAGSLPDLERVSRQLAASSLGAYKNKLSLHSMEDVHTSSRGPTLLAGRQRNGLHQAATASTTVEAVQPRLFPPSRARQAPQHQVEEQKDLSAAKLKSPSHESLHGPRALLAALIVFLSLAAALSAR